MNLNDPKTIESWEQSEDNVCDAKVVVVNLAFFNTRNLSKLEQGEAVAFPLHANDALSNGLSREQIDASREFVKHEEAYFENLRTAVYTYYRNNHINWLTGISLGQQIFGAVDDFVEAKLPKIIDGTEIDQKVTLGEITIGRNGHIGFTFSAEWDENGIGVEMDRGKVVDIGNWFVGNL